MKAELPRPGPGAAAVLERIARAAARAGRDRAAITLVGAAKTVEPERIVDAGVADVGENRVQELAAKQEVLAAYPIRWHFIGRLQRNKIRAVVGRVALIHSIDSLDLAAAVAVRAHDLDVTQHVLLQVNVSGEATKAGVGPADLDRVLAEARRLDHLSVRGLMTIPAPGDPARSRAAFRSLAAMAAAHGLSDLSMGMSGDFEIAVEEGATMVRVGTAIYGPRPPATPGPAREPG